MVPTLNLTKLLLDGSTGNFSLNVEKAENGIIINVNAYSTVKGTDPSSPMGPSESSSKRYVFSGTAEEINLAVEEELGLGQFLTV